MAAVTIGCPVIRVDAAGSTMDLLAALADRGATPGTTVQAGFQSAGRGRAGREWHAEPWSSILLSFLHVSHRSQASLGLFAPAIGLAVAITADAWLPNVTNVKWPNDVLVDGRKLAGVLVTTRSLNGGAGTRVICGIGLNVGSLSETLPGTATSLSIEAGCPVGIEPVLGKLLINLSEIVSSFEEGDDRCIADHLNERLAWRGQPVSVRDGDRTHTGTLDGLDIDGSLLVRDSMGNVVRIVAGDLTRGPRVHPSRLG